ncbi:hypothetical protein BGX30_009589, partial [Mortierella sp. GBA39]
SMFQRHSSTLREISLNGYMRIDSKVVQTILVECEALESFKVHCPNYCDPRPLCLHLEDAIEIPWASTRIQELQLAIAIPERPLFLPVDGTTPYYNRPPPTTLSVEETQQFKDLESFYRQIGKLTQLRRLDLRAHYYDPTGKRDRSRAFGSNAFPGMMNLGGEKTGRPGYLQLLGGLTKLKTLVGSVAADTKETMSFLTLGLTSDDIGSLFRRQSGTLREIVLADCLNFDSRAIQTILVECWALERLEVQFMLVRGSNHQQQQPALRNNLDDAIESPGTARGSRI